MRFLFPALLCLTASAFAQGGAAVYALDAPPPGGEGYSSLQSGGAFPTGATSLFYNPALLAEIERATGSQIHAAISRQTWPALFSGVSQNFIAAAAVVPDAKGFDLGVGLFRNQIDYGHVLLAGDSLSPPVAPYRAVETVYGVGVGLRLGLPVSVGAAVKYYDSRFGPDEGAQASGLAFDLGISANPRFRPAAEIASFELRPSAGLALQNLGEDVSYNSQGADPLPRALRASLGAEAGFADLLECSLGQEWHKGWWNSWSDPSLSRTFGGSVSLAGFRYGWATWDYSGSESETYEAYQFEFEALRVYRLWQRIQRRDFVSAPETLEAGYPFRRMKVLGISYRFNPRFVVGRRGYDADSEDFRDAQKAWFASIAL